MGVFWFLGWEDTSECCIFNLIVNNLASSLHLIALASDSRGLTVRDYFVSVLFLSYMAGTFVINHQ